MSGLVEGAATATCTSPWFAGLTCDHLYDDCPNRRRGLAELRRYDMDVSGPAIDPHGTDICGLCVYRHNRKEHLDEPAKPNTARIQLNVPLDKLGVTVTEATLERFWSHVAKSESCWLWRNALKSNGYAAFGIGERVVLSHRFSYYLAKGPIPTGLVIDHLCRVRHCVNPVHLEAVTVRENNLRGVGPAATRAQQTHCKRGHEFTPENTGKSRGGRRCLACSREDSAKRRQLKIRKPCPACGQEIRENNLAKHLLRMHPGDPGSMKAAWTDPGERWRASA